MQRAAAGALRTLAFKNEDNKNLIVSEGALPVLIQMLKAEDAGIHYEAVGVIGNLVHSSPHIKKKVCWKGLRKIGAEMLITLWPPWCIPTG